jgi:hypothetical protein
MNVKLQEQIAPDTAQAIIALASTHGQSVNDYLRSLLGLNGSPPAKLDSDNEQDEKPLAELLEGLTGVVDSSVPDPDSPPRHTDFGQHLLEKHRKQIENLP